MARVTLPDIVDAVADKLRLATVIMPGELVARAFTVQSYDELTEAIQDLPTIQVYPELEQVDVNGLTDRTTLKVGTQHAQVVITIRTFARQRSHLADDMAAAVKCWDMVDKVLEDVSTDCLPFFDLVGVRAFNWTATFTPFQYGNVTYAGVEHTLNLEVY